MGHKRDDVRVVSFGKYGECFAQRFLAAEIISAAGINDQTNLVILDFAGVEFASASFIEEIFLRLKYQDIAVEQITMINIADERMRLKTEAEMLRQFRHSIAAIVQH